MKLAVTFINFQLRKINCCIIAALFLLSSCKQNDVTPGVVLLFDSVPVTKAVVPLINETSGIADSKINPGYLWGHEDSGTPNQLYLINHNGTVAKTVVLKNLVNRDWEDMALVNNEIYIAEIGDNAQAWPSYAFYKFQEPLSSTDTVKSIETISFTYPDGKHDAEAFIVDPLSKDIFIFTKSDNPSHIYMLAYPYTAANVVSLAGSLPYTGVVSAALSANGQEMIIKTYTTLNYYKRLAGQTVTQALQSSPTLLKYVMEPQGEAICFAQDGSGFYTLSEKGFVSYVNLNFYKRR